MNLILKSMDNYSLGKWVQTGIFETIKTRVCLFHPEADGEEIHNINSIKNTIRQFVFTYA